MKNKICKKERLVQLKKENERALVEQIRRLLALPPNKRVHFLRKRTPWGGSSLYNGRREKCNKHRHKAADGRGFSPTAIHEHPRKSAAE